MHNPDFEKFDFLTKFHSEQYFYDLRPIFGQFCCNFFQICMGGPFGPFKIWRASKIQQKQRRLFNGLGTFRRNDEAHKVETA